MKDYAQGKVLPEFTDDHLRSESSNEVFRLLLLVPAEQRQNVVAEAVARSTVTVRGRYGEDSYTQITRPWLPTLAEVIAENGWPIPEAVE